MTKTAKQSPKKRNARQEKKEKNIQINPSLGSFSNNESSIAVISKSTKLARGNSKGLQSCLDEALKTYKPKKVKQRQENAIQSCSKSSDDDVNLRNLSNSVASTSKPTRNSSPRKGKRTTDSTSPLRRSPRKSVQPQQKVFFFMHEYLNCYLAAPSVRFASVCLRLSSFVCVCLRLSAKNFSCYTFSVNRHLEF